MTKAGLIIIIATICIILVELWEGAQNGSAFFLAFTCLLLAMWDGIAIWYGLPYTISWRIREAAMQHPFLLIGIGELIGHFFTNMKPEGIP